MEAYFGKVQRVHASFNDKLLSYFDDVQARTCFIELRGYSLITLSRALRVASSSPTLTTCRLALMLFALALCVCIAHCRLVSALPLCNTLRACSCQRCSRSWAVRCKWHVQRARSRALGEAAF